MTYTEIKEKGIKKYYYRVKSIRQGKKVNKQRIYLGVNLKKQELQEKEQQAHKKLLNIQEKTKITAKKQEEKDKQGKRITFDIDKNKNFSEWYTNIVKKAELADLRSNVKGFVVFQPW